MSSTIQGKSPVRKDTGFSPVPLNSMHTSTADFFRWHVVKAIPMIPKDTISFSVDSFIQSAPQPFPINGNFSYAMHAFFVPNRLVWKDWKYYYTELQQGLTPPYFTLSDLYDAVQEMIGIGGLEYRNASIKFISDIDSLGSVVKFLQYSNKADIPVSWQNLKLSALPLRMIQCLWFDWMRDKMHISDNAKSSYVFDTGGHISQAELQLLIAPKFRNYAKNMFTAAYDDPQEGASANMLGTIPSVSENPGFPAGGTPGNIQYDGSDSPKVYKAGWNTNANDVISSTSVNELRKKSSEQQLAERLEVAGKTIVSRCLALLGVSPTFEELQMSNWLGGNEFELKPNQQLTPNSSSNTESSSGYTAGAFGLDPAQQTIAGQRFQDVSSPQDMGLKNITYKSDESGYFIVMGCVTPNVQYFQGLSKNWTAGLDTFNSDVMDFFHSDFENQPFEPVMFYEVCCDDRLNPKNIFGFQLMYSRYKQAFDSIGGDFLMDYDNTLFDSMHLGRDISELLTQLSGSESDINQFLTPANLRQSSIYDVINFDKKFTLTDASKDHFIANHKISINMLRPMQLFTLPSLDSELSRATPKDLLETGGFSV